MHSPTDLEHNGRFRIETTDDACEIRLIPRSKRFSSLVVLGIWIAATLATVFTWWAYRFALPSDYRPTVTLLFIAMIPLAALSFTFLTIHFFGNAMIVRVDREGLHILPPKDSVMIDKRSVPLCDIIGVFGPSDLGPRSVDYVICVLRLGEPVNIVVGRRRLFTDAIAIALRQKVDELRKCDATPA